MRLFRRKQEALKPTVREQVARQIATAIAVRGDCLEVYGPVPSVGPLGGQLHKVSALMRSSDGRATSITVNVYASEWARDGDG